MHGLDTYERLNREAAEAAKKAEVPAEQPAQDSADKTPAETKQAE